MIGCWFTNSTTACLAQLAVVGLNCLNPKSLVEDCYKSWRRHGKEEKGFTYGLVICPFCSMNNMSSCRCSHSVTIFSPGTLILIFTCSNITVCHSVKFLLQIDSYWNVAFFKNPLLLFYKSWSDHVTAAEFVGKDGRHRLLTQMPWKPIDNFYFCSPNLSHCYLSCGKLQLLQPPSLPPSSEQRMFPFGLGLWCSHVQSWMSVRMYCNLIISWDTGCCINYSVLEITRHKT